MKKYFEYQAEDRSFIYNENHNQVELQEEHAGCYALLTESNLELSEIITGYKTLLAVEDASEL